MSAGFQFRNITRVLSQRNFGLFTLGSTITLVGTWMQRIGVGWLTWELTHSTTWLGIVGFADLFPAVVIAPFSGVAADIWDRHRMMRGAQFVGVVIGGMMATLYFVGLLDIWGVLLFTLVLGILDSFVQPFRLAFLSTITLRSELATAVAIKSVTFNVARFVGPAFAGPIILWGSVGWVFALNALSFLCFMVVLILMDVEPWRPDGARTLARGTILRQAASGVALAFANRGVAAVLILLAITCFAARPIADMLPAWATTIFSGGAADLAALTSAMGVGAVAGGVWLAGRPSPIGLMRILAFGSVGLGISVMLFSLSWNVYMALPVIAVVGFFMIATGTCAQTIVQLSAADDERGRVLSVYAVILRGCPAIGALIMGATAETTGLRFPLVLGSAAIVAGAVWMLQNSARLTASTESALKRSDDPKTND